MGGLFFFFFFFLAGDSKADSRVSAHLWKHSEPWVREASKIAVRWGFFRFCVCFVLWRRHDTLRDIGRGMSIVKLEVCCWWPNGSIQTGRQRTKPAEVSANLTGVRSRQTTLVYSESHSNEADRSSGEGGWNGSGGSGEEEVCGGVGSGETQWMTNVHLSAWGEGDGRLSKTKHLVLLWESGFGVNAEVGGMVRKGGEGGNGTAVGGGVGVHCGLPEGRNKALQQGWACKLRRKVKSAIDRKEALSGTHVALTRLSSPAR